MLSWLDLSVCLGYFTTVAWIVSGTSAILVTAAWSAPVMALVVSGVMVSLMVYCLSARRTSRPCWNLARPYRSR